MQWLTHSQGVCNVIDVDLVDGYAVKVNIVFNKSSIQVCMCSAFNVKWLTYSQSICSAIDVVLLDGHAVKVT